MKLNEWIDNCALELAANFASKMEAYREAHYLARAILGQIVESKTSLSLIAQKCLDHALAKRKKNMPLAKIIERKEFYNKMFITTQDTLDPRPETEAIIDEVAIKPRSILDLGTGTGCLIITLLTKFPKANAIGIDICEKALNIAKKNAKIHLGKLQKKIQFIQSNWANQLPEHYNHFDLIVSNPPYIDKKDVYEKNLPPNLVNALKYEPSQALFGDSKTYKAMLESLINITFSQMLIEAPDNLVLDIKTQIEKMLPNYKIEIQNLNGTNISIINIFS